MAIRTGIDAVKILRQRAFDAGRWMTRPMRRGDVVRPAYEDEDFIVTYVNNAGANVVPVNRAQRVIGGKVINFTREGKLISADSLVELRGCVDIQEDGKMKKGSGSKGKVGKGKANSADAEVKEPEQAINGDGTQGASFGEFDAADIDDEDGQAGEGHAAGADTETPDGNGQGTDMAKAKGKGKAKGGTKAKREKAPKKLRKCACGCGGETQGYFSPGHDARMHGWIAKLADGRIEPKDVPAAVRSKLDLVQTNSGFKARKPHFWTDEDK